jgi:PKD repeat protein/glucose/arabinose dehydrogenase/type 1 glutamine amidotransferase
MTLDTRRLARTTAATLKLACLAALVALAAAANARAQEPAASVLLFHDGSDAVTDAGIAAIQALGDDHDFAVDVSGDPTDITAANLDQYAAVVFLDADGDVLADSQENALRNYVQDGNGFLGIGATAEAEEGSSFFDGLIGARPSEPCPPEPEPGQNCSPTGAIPQVVVAGDRVHPATRDLPLQITRTDQWYRWQQRPTGQVHTVARWHAPNDPAGDGTNVGGTDHPVSWCRDFQGGRSFYTAMGRTAGSYSEAEFEQHLLGAIQWAAGLVRANCKATISSNYGGERLVDASSGDLTHSGESHGLSIAENGWVVYIGRGDCRTNAQRGEVAGLAGPTDRILNFADPNVGVGCGNVHIFDPAEHDGTVNSGATLAGIIPVYGDRGGGAEINGKIEAGLLGITLAPDFIETGHIYVQYFPTFNPDNPNLPGLADGDDRRRTKMHTPRISRFTIDLETKELDLSSEVVIFEYESQIYSCCHRGGGMGFDSEGNLYVTTGDSNSSGGTGGYSGNNPPPKCPMRDPGEPDQESANNNDCGELNYSYQDARRTAGSTNDYNGKMLRFNPIDDIPDGTQPEIGIGTTYDLPTADSPNGPNLFDGTEGGGGLTKPEIYAMGLRNPSRLSIDPETDIPYSAWVGPDAGSPNASQGPSTYESAAQIAQAGNYGWPYCMGNQQAYRDRLADGSLRNANESGFVSGGPAGSPIQGFYDCDNLVNDSPNNTGLEVLPHETGTGMDAGTARPVNVWYSRGNPGGANGCPDFAREQGPNGAPNYGGTPAQFCPYATASGATIFDGPVYRYPDTADPAVAWPEYWDGRWFLQDFGNNSVKHGLLLDPDTDQDGSQPIYADSLRGGGGLNLSWQANYMDSKFAPDGSYYVQVYQGFFTTGNQAGLYRFTYTGGPDTPGADPQWQATGTPLEVQFDRGASGGVAYEWDFGDGSPVSTEANPVHTYEGDGPYEVTLTVTYADDQTDSKTITVNPSGEDTTPPVTTIQLDGAEPVPNYDGPVEVTLAATDEGGVGVEVIRYAVDGGAFTDYTGPFTVSGAGEHVIEYRSRDGAGNVEDTQSVTFTIAGVGGGPCLPQSDEFEGSELDAKWDVLREVEEDPPVVGGGAVTLPLRQGDFIANDPLAENVLLQDAPNGQWTATAALDIGDINGPGEQAGLVMWKSESPNTFSKIVFIQANSGQRQFEHIVTQGGSVNPPIPQSITPAPAGLPADGTVLLRARYDGTAVTGEFSDDNGATWTLIGQEGHEAPLAAPLRIGLTAFRGSSGEGNASFQWFRTHEGSEPGGPTGCGGGGGDSCDEFDGTELDPKWELVNPSLTNPPTVAGGHLNMPIIPGDLFGGNGNAQMLLQGVPTEQSWVLTAKIAHANIDTNGEAAGLALVNTLSPPSADNHFAKTALQFKNDTDPDEPGDQPGVWAERVLTADSMAVTLPPETVPFPNSGALDFAGDYGWVRFVHDAVAEEIGTWTSTDGETFVNFGQNMPVDEYLSEPGGLRAGVFAKHDGTGDDVVQIDAFNVVLGSADPQTPPDECNAGGGGDNTPPTTTATLDPPEPDGENGWFTTPVEVTLAATDNQGGSGVESTLYAIDGGDFTDYEEPFTVSGDGEHEVEFRSTDAEGNLEATKSVEIKIDGTPPETEATVDGNEVTLEADDGPNGSGVAETEFRIDGGPWQTYVKEETILGSESDLGRWAQAGPGGLNWLEVTDTVVEVTASAENPPNEVAGNLVDGSAETKWLVFESTGWVEFELSEPSAVVRYALTSANDAPGRDPSDWTLSGSDDGETWTELDQQSGQDFPERLERKVYEFENQTAYGHYRLDFTANHGDELLQLAEVELSDGSSGFARTEGGLGMPWYPVKEYGDFSLKLEWRDSSTGTAGNSGVFVRFPDPRIPLANRPTTGPGDWDGQYCGRTGSAAGDPAWVAIYCGQEIQINDYQSDTQKTGSIYNFAPVVDPDHMPDPRGEWVDYEVRVEGQQYTILRNGTVLNEFDNSIPLESSRGGDPPTDARQFDRGYIGLQNHGGADVIDFRNVRILPLDEGAVEGPILIEDGQRLEFRSTDAAGNVEAIKGLGGEADLRTRVKPKRKKVKVGSKATFKFTATNRGNAAAEDVELCIRAPKKQVKVPGADCREFARLGPDASRTASFKVKPKRSAAGDRVRLRFVANAANAGRASERATLKVKQRKRRR